ncbi:MAG: DUF3419 family protein [Desulfobacterales bacterium]|nr:DUF3419 family protein [Desulfobacterales bacterium]
MAKIEEKARFDFIRYANCWEDADILFEALDIKSGDKCISIASAGDNSLSLLVGDPELVVAIDLNKAQLACLNLRIAAFKHLNYDEVIKLLGIEKESNREKIYFDIKESMNDDSKSFWDNNLDLIKNGVIHAGKFENYFDIFRNYVLPLIHWKSAIDSLLEKKDISSQREFYKKYWDNINWRILFRIFFGKFTMGLLGRDPEFFNYVEGSVASNLLNRTKYAFTEIPTYSNPYLNYIFNKNFPKHALPMYLRENNFEKIKSNIDRIKPFHGDLRASLKEYNQIKFDAFNLSDIFEYMSMAEYRDELSNIVSSSSKGARIAFWNMLADRTIPDDFPVKTNKDFSETLHKKDKAWFYKRFIIAET